MASKSSSPTITTSSTSSSGTSNKHVGRFTLPDGRMMDCKNTLQSFDVPTPSVRHPVVMVDVTAADKVTTSNTGSRSVRILNDPLAADAFTTGEVIYKSSIDSITLQQPNDIENNIQPCGSTNRYNDNIDDSNRNNETIRTEAVAVRSMVVAEAMIYETPEQGEEEKAEELTTLQNKKSTTQRDKKGMLFWLVVAMLTSLVVVVVVAVIGIGYCFGTGNCFTNSDDPEISADPTTINTTLTPNDATSVSTMDQELLVVCNFLSVTSLSLCQDITTFSGLVVGDTIPSEIGLLTRLQSLDLYQNQLFGTIPSTIGNLLQLTGLYLYVNQLTGTIPSTLGNLLHLTGLYLSENQLTGSIPSSFGNLIHLKYLYLYNNQLTGSLPSSIGNLGQLETLSLTGNQLVGTLPTTMQNLYKLQNMAVYNNEFTGTLSSDLGRLSLLTKLGLASNRFTGTIPSTFGYLVQLTQLDLFGNIELGGTIPSILCTVSGIKIGIDCGIMTCSCCLDKSTGISCS